MLKIASWNVNSLRVRLAQLLQWLEAASPDLVGLQETKTTDEQFPRADIEAAGYQVIFSGQKTYNGVAILSRTDAEPVEVVTDLPGFDDAQRRVLGATYGNVRLLNLYVPNGSEIGSDKYDYKLDWLAALAAHLEVEIANHGHVVVVGDFNIAPEDRDVHDPQLWEGQVLCSGPERQAFRRLLDCGLVDTFRQFDQQDAVFSWWDYRAAAFRRNMGLRIDHILASAELARVCTSSVVDKTPRTWERPSDHAPVVAEFDL
ncbi:MAG: exodeoxyribonuclease III [Gammaproteobacteria bacterium SG8_47]|nr:MAG: exodeoxyribonuclease III [Gammaproteobacteria bacterium SG8_47]